MKWWWFGAGLAVVWVVGCKASISGDASFSAQTGGDMMGADDDSAGDGAGSAGRGSTAAGSGSGGSSAAGSGGSTAQAGNGVPPAGGTGASGNGTTDPPDEPGPNPDVGGPYDLGELPPGFSIAWPAEPLITQEVEVRTREEFEQAATTDGTRIVLKQNIDGVNGFVNAYGSDIEIQMDPGVRINATLGLASGHERIRVLGGRYAGIMMSPIQGNNPLTQDVTIDGVTVDSPTGSAFLLRGRRIAIIRSTATAQLFSVYADAISGEPNGDIIIAGNVLDSVDESTVRLISTISSVTVDNRLTNTGKHNYRIHGTSARSFAARNVLITSGTMLGTLPGDLLDEAWFNDNTFYHTTPDLFHPEAASVTVLHAHGNTAYTDVWPCFYCSTVPPGWDLQNNRVMAYQPPP